MKRISLLLLSLTLTASLFIGCGSNNAEGKDANTQTSSESSVKFNLKKFQGIYQ